MAINTNEMLSSEKKLKVDCDLSAEHSTHARVLYYLSILLSFKCFDMHDELLAATFRTKSAQCSSTYSTTLCIHAN